MKMIDFRRFLIVTVIGMPFFVYSQQTTDSLADEKYWEFAGKTGITLTQTGQVNWVQGGVPAVSYLGTLELSAKFNKDKNSWETEGKFAYGQQSQGYENDFRTSDDRIDIASKYGYKMSKLLYVSALASFKSQFAKGYEYPDDLEAVQVSDFMSPAYVTGALGIDYKPNKNTSVFISPISVKSTFVKDSTLDETKYGLELGESVRNEIGAFVKATHKLELIENVNMENSIELFSNYLDNPQNIDVLWDFKLIMSVNKYLKTVLSTTLIYNDDIAIPKNINKPEDGYTKAIQFKEMLSVGLLLSF